MLSPIRCVDTGHQDKQQNLYICTMGTLIVHPDTKKKLTALKAVMRALNISFEEEEAPYNPNFVAKVKKSQADFKAGRYEVIETEDLWK